MTSPDGLHLRPLALISQFAVGQECRITLRRGDLVADATSVLELITLEAACGAKLELVAEGPGADEAVAALAGMFERNFPTDHPGSTTSGP